MAKDWYDWATTLGYDKDAYNKYFKDGQLKQGYSTSGTIGGSEQVFSYTSKGQMAGTKSARYRLPSSTFSIYKLPAQQAAPAEETKPEPTVEQAAPPVINNPYANEIANRTTPGPTPKAFIDQFGGNKETYAGSGLAAVQRAEAAGYSIPQIQQMGIDQGITFGPSAQSYFNQTRETQYQNQLSGMQRQQTEYLNDLQIQQNQRLDRIAAEQRAAAEALALGQRTALQNQARAGQMGALQIGGATQTPRTGGTQGFKRRKLQINPVTANALSGILGGTSAETQTNVLNV